MKSDNQDNMIDNNNNVIFIYCFPFHPFSPLHPFHPRVRVVGPRLGVAATQRGCLEIAGCPGMSEKKAAGR